MTYKEPNVCNYKPVTERTSNPRYLNLPYPVLIWCIHHYPPVYEENIFGIVHEDGRVVTTISPGVVLIDDIICHLRSIGQTWTRGSRNHKEPDYRMGSWSSSLETIWKDMCEKRGQGPDWELAHQCLIAFLIIRADETRKFLEAQEQGEYEQ